MPIYLDEDQAGQDATLIGFPHLLLCQGVVCVLADGSLVGGHFTTGSSEAAVSGRMQAMMTARGSAIARIYVAYDSGRKAASAADAQGKAALFGFHGDVYFFDCSSIAPQDGTYVQVTSLGAGQSSLVQYKRNEKMSYTPGPKLPGSNRMSTADAQLAPGATKLHKAGHILNMTHYTV